MALQILHLHTYFLFPFSVDRQAVVEDHPDAWANCHRWIDGLDGWIKRPYGRTSSAVVEHLGPWQAKVGTASTYLAGVRRSQSVNLRKRP